MMSIFVVGSSDFISHTSLELLLQNLTQRHRDIFMHISEMELKRREFIALKASKAKDRSKDPMEQSITDSNNPNWNSKGIILDGLFDVCRSKLIVQNIQILQQNLRELKDHKIISISSSGTSQDGRQYISVFLSTALLQSLLGSKREI